MGKCNLRCACITIAIVSLLLSGIVVFSPDANLDVQTIAAIVVGVVGALALLFGAINKDERLILVSLILWLLGLLWGVIALLGVYFDFGGFRDSGRPGASVNEMLLTYLFSFVLECIFTYVVYSYYNELHDSGDD